jgi:hypothetical protein
MELGSGQTTDVDMTRALKNHDILFAVYLFYRAVRIDLS